MANTLVSGYIGFNNFGDEAIFLALSTHLKSLGHNVSVLCNNKKEVKKKYQVKSYNYKSLMQIIKAILSCDILISGGGSLLQNKTSNFSLLYYLFIIFLAKLFFKKVIIFAQGIEPINGSFFKFLTVQILKRTDYICVRDENSKKLLESYNIKTDLVSDPAYSLVQDLKIEQNKQGLIVQLRDFNGINKEIIKNLAKGISKNYQGKISILSLQDEVDEKICLEFKEELKKLNIDSVYISNKSIYEIIDIINNSEFVISTRLHGLLIANALKCKTFALSYDAKTDTLCSELNILKTDIFENENLDNKLNEFFNHCINEVHPFRRFSWDCIDTNLK